MLNVKWTDKEQSIISYSTTELQDKLTDALFFEKLTVKQAAKKFNEKESDVKQAYIDLMSALYGDSAKSIIESNF